MSSQWRHAVCTLLLLVATAGAQSGPPRLARVTRMLADWTTDGEPGALVVVAWDDGRTWSATGGFANVEDGVPFERLTHVPLGQCSAQVLRDVFRQAVEGGAFAWRDTVGATIEKLPSGIAERTWRELVGGEAPLPYYHRFGTDRARFRPAAEVVATHACVDPEGPRFSHLDEAILEAALTRQASWSSVLADYGERTGIGFRTGAPDDSPLISYRGVDEIEPAGTQPIAEIASAFNIWIATKDVPRLLQRWLAAEDELSWVSMTKRDEEVRVLASSDGVTVRATLCPAQGWCALIVANTPGFWHLQPALLSDLLGRGGRSDPEFSSDPWTDEPPVPKRFLGRFTGSVRTDAGEFDVDLTVARTGSGLTLDPLPSETPRGHFRDGVLTFGWRNGSDRLGMRLEPQGEGLAGVVVVIRQDETLPYGVGLSRVR